jgi:ligand-binding SRPBCC domain-containing protein
VSTETVHDTALVHAPLERVWKLSTRVELVKNTLGMNFAGGQTTGFVHQGTRVVWKGWKFGLPTEHHTLITGYAAPHPAAAEPSLGFELHAEDLGQPVAWFQDQQESGRFAYFQHDHWMRERTGPEGAPVTVLEDEVHFSLPWGPFGRLAARHIMAPYIRKLVRHRFGSLKALAEGDGWRQWM